MQVDVNALVELIFEGDVSPSPACQACEDMLDQYVDEELAGKDAAKLFPDVNTHLNECTSCQESYQELKALLLMQRQGTFVEPPVEANFDFSFIPAPQPTSIWQMVEKAGREVKQLFTELRVVVEKGEAFFDQLPNPLKAEWDVVLMPSRRTSEQKRVPLLLLPSPEHDLALHLMVNPPGPKEKEPVLIVDVKKHSSQQPVARARVTMRDKNHRMLESNVTREEGRVTFANVRSGTYLVEVKYKKQRWELSITVTWQE